MQQNNLKCFKIRIQEKKLAPMKSKKSYLTQFTIVVWCFQGVEKECIGNKWVWKHNFHTLSSQNKNLRVLYTFYWPHFPKNKKMSQTIEHICDDWLITLRIITLHFKLAIVVFPASYWNILFLLIWTHNAPVLNHVIFYPFLQTGISVTRKSFFVAPKFHTL